MRLIFLEEFGKAFVPRKITPNLRKYLLKAGISSVPYKFFGALFYITAAITAIIYLSFIYPYISKFSLLLMLILSATSWFGIQLLLVALSMITVYFFLDLRIFARTKQMEELLPDFLMIVSSNLKGGLSFENALFGAIKPRFKILASEMEEVSKKVMTGYDVSVALQELSEKYNSPMLSRSIDLMISEIQSGGHIAGIIDNIVEGLKEIQTLKKDISASVVTYTIFTAVIVIFIAPLLFALSYHLLQIILGFVSKLSSAASSTQTLFTVRQIAVNPQQFQSFSVAALVIIAFFSSLIVSILEKGHIKSGLKYIPIFTSASIICYFVLMKVLSFLFQSLSV